MVTTKCSKTRGNTQNIWWILFVPPNVPPPHWNAPSCKTLQEYSSEMLQTIRLSNEQVSRYNFFPFRYLSCEQPVQCTVSSANTAPFTKIMWCQWSMNGNWALVKWNWQLKTGVLVEITVILPQCPPQSPYGEPGIEHGPLLTEDRY